MVAIFGMKLFIRLLLPGNFMINFISNIGEIFMRYFVLEKSEISVQSLLDELNRNHFTQSHNRY